MNLKYENISAKDWKAKNKYILNGCYSRVQSSDLLFIGRVSIFYTNLNQ